MEISYTQEDFRQDWIEASAGLTESLIEACEDKLPDVKEDKLEKILRIVEKIEVHIEDSEKYDQGLDREAQDLAYKASMSPDWAKDAAKEQRADIAANRIQKIISSDYNLADTKLHLEEVVMYLLVGKQPQWEMEDVLNPVDPELYGL